MKYNAWLKNFQSSWSQEHPHSGMPQNHVLYTFYLQDMKRKYESEFEIIDGINCQREGLTFEQWMEKYCNKD